MSDHPNIKVPHGHMIVTGEDGSIEVVATGERLTKTVAFRITPSEYVALLPFLDTFPNGSMALAMRYLFEHQSVQDVISARVAASRIPA